MPLGANKAAIMGVAGVSDGETVVLIQTQTADDSSAIAFTSGINSTYGHYIFRFYNVNVETNQAVFHFQVNAAGESGYNEVITNTHLQTAHQETDGGTPYIVYATANDNSDETTYIKMMDSCGSGSDECLDGELHLYNPSSTTFVTHFQHHTTQANGDTTRHMVSGQTGGYVNTTAAITGVNFKCSTGNFDGVIKLWGVKT